MEENNCRELLEFAKKHPHSHVVSSEAMSLEDRDFVFKNIYLKNDPTSDFDRINFRRGLSFITEIKDYKEGELNVARKGLRKFNSLMPEWLGLKQSHYSVAKIQLAQKNRFLDKLQNDKWQKYGIYITQKANGENAQVSAFEDYWIFGSKKKTIIIKSLDDKKFIKFPHQYKLPLLIARLWFEILEKLSEQEVKQLRAYMQNKTLIGEHINTSVNQHLIDYGKQPKLFFYAIVQNNDDLRECVPPSETFEQFKKFKLPSIQYEYKQSATLEHLLQTLKNLYTEIYEKPMKQGGEGKVLYIIATHKGRQQCLSILKLKTLQYRIWRKLRQKLKNYIEKLNKTHAKLQKKFNEQIQQLMRGFNSYRSFQQYSQLGKKAFELCEDQTNVLANFISRKYLIFLQILQRKDINKEKFMQILKQGKFQLQPEQNDQQQPKQIKNQISQSLQPTQKKQQKNKTNLKLLVFVPVTIPSTGKSSLFKIISEKHENYNLKIVSSDTIRQSVMQQMMKKNKNLKKKEAFQKSRKAANDIFYKEITKLLKQIGQQQHKQNIFFVDKNHPQNALPQTISHIKKNTPKNVDVKVIGLFPKCQEYIEKPGKYFYPFSYSYILTCLNRVINRKQHQTLEGSEEQRCSIVMNFANMFRNFSLTEYNISKYFDAKTQFIFHNEDDQWPEDINKIVLEILFGSQPGKFDIHPLIEQLIKKVQQHKSIQISRQDSGKYAIEKVQKLFEQFYYLNTKVQKQQKEE